MKKIFLLFTAILALNFVTSAQATIQSQTTQVGTDQNVVFEEHLVAAFGMLALTPEQESATRNEINSAIYDIEAIMRNSSLNENEKYNQIQGRNDVKNKKIKDIMLEEKYTIWKKIRANQNEMQDVPPLH